MPARFEESFILASASPRRKQLLLEQGCRFEVIPSEVDEASVPRGTDSPAEYAMRLAHAKAESVAGRHPEKLVVGADTIVEHDGQIIGKARDAIDAERILRMLFAGPHEVITGLAFVRKASGLCLLCSDITVVYPHKLSNEQILTYIQSGHWQGKAGAYGIQDTHDEFVERIDGSFSNVVGMPVELFDAVMQHLSRSGI